MLKCESIFNRKNKGGTMAELVKLGSDGKLGSIGNKTNKQSEGTDICVLSTLTLWLYLFFMYIPFAGWIVSISFALSKKENLYKKNLAKATLINKVILLVIILVIYFVVSRFVGVLVGKLEGMVNLLQVVPENGSEMLEYVSMMKQQLQGIVDILK
jgi:hypothetical protein